MNFMGLSDAVATAPHRLPSGPPAWREDDLISSLLEEQGDLTAIERFSQFYEAEGGSLRARRYEALLPATPPGPGQQLAFEVDLDRCSGCKACVAACHALNGLDEGETWREVGLLIGGSPSLPVLQHVTSSCHHCLEPACLNACPVDAYEKDPITGIVAHLDDQCIGCQYCTLACPYDAPKFHSGKGIVRKCDLCAGRLRAGEAPACVAACPHEAIRIRVVDRAEIRERASAGVFLPSAPDPEYTRPTTTYRSRSPIAAGPMLAVDEHHLEPDHAHPPLVVMLVLTQLSVGGLLVELAARLISGTGVASGRAHFLISLGLGFAGLLASVLHLGRPLYAYRAILGVRHSWLSREVLAFGLFATLATVFAAVDLQGESPALATKLLGAATAAGAVGVGCSVMVYHAVRRPSWRARVSGVKFAGTTAVLGLSVALAGLGLSGSGAAGPDAVPMVLIAAALSVLVAAKLRFESTATRRRADDDRKPLLRSELLIRGPLARVASLRRGLGLAGGIVLPTAAVIALGWADPRLTAAVATLALIASIGGELAERWLFFAAVDRQKMPGGLSS